jgi:hypothetical protein
MYKIEMMKSCIIIGCIILIGCSNKQPVQQAQVYDIVVNRINRYDMMQGKEKQEFDEYVNKLKFTSEQKELIRRAGARITTLAMEQVFVNDVQIKEYEAEQERHKDEYGCVTSENMFSVYGFWTKDKSIYDEWQKVKPQEPTWRERANESAGYEISDEEWEELMSQFDSEVVGEIKARELKEKMNVAGSFYEFEKKYKLPTKF